LLLATGGGAIFVSGQDMAPAASPIVLDHPDPTFRMTVPAGYKVAANPPGAAYSYQRSGRAPIVLNVQPMNGSLRPDDRDSEIQAATLKQLPAGSQVRVGREAWGPHQIVVIESEFSLQG